MRPNTKIVGASIIDVAPNILHLFILSIPNYLDGAVLSDIYYPDYLKTHPLQFPDSALGDGK